ncbi:MAG: ATP-binding cassette subfamily B multidrug efflux pump [Gammaproteobacteria bacterium]|jgi:ATP-binding cassette subfamily B multidrug efflux pump
MTSSQTPKETSVQTPAATATATSRPGDSQDVPGLIPRSARAGMAAVGFDWATLKRITAMALRYRLRMGVAIVATILAGASQIAIPQLIGSAVDQARQLLAGGDLDAARHALTLTAAWLLGVSVVRGVLTMTQNFQGEAVGHLLAHDLRLRYYTKLQHLSFSYHDRVHTGELMTRGILDIEGARMWVHTGILRAFLLTILLIGGAGLLLSIDPVLTCVALAFVPFVGLGAGVARLKLRALWFALQEELGILTRIMEENLGGIRVVRAFSGQVFEMLRFDFISKRALAITHSRIRIFVTSTSSMTFGFFLSMGLVLWVGGERVLSGDITLGELTAFLAFMTILQQPVRQIAWMVNSIARASTCGARLFEILDLEPDIRDRPNATALNLSAGRLTFEDVSFSYYANEEHLTLEHVSFDVSPGKVLGIVGPPGSGKSTIAHLIPRFYDVTSGRICIDGQDIRDVTLESLRHHVNIIAQDAFLFTSAIDANVAYGDPWADRSAIRQATETAQLHNYIAQLPESYETLVGERGVSLSGGQRQRLAIARSVLPNAGVLVFDDSTAAVDAGTEHEIRSALRETTAARATVIIAHRLSSLRHADEILFLEQGRVVERGSHDQLVKQGGRYAALDAMQTLDPGGDAL